MDDCASLGELIERHLASAAASEEDKRVRAHLAACADCRDYVARARRVEVELTRALEPPVPGDARWKQVRARVRAHLQGRSALLGFAALCVAFAPVEALGWLGDSAPDAWWMALMLLGLAGVLVLGALDVSRDLARASAGDLFAWAYRRARRERWGVLWMLGWFSAAGVAAAVLAWQGQGVLRAAWLVLGAVQVIVAMACVQRFRALRREIEVLA